MEVGADNVGAFPVVLEEPEAGVQLPAAGKVSDPALAPALELLFTIGDSSP